MDWNPIKEHADVHSALAADSEDSAENLLTDSSETQSSSWLSRVWQALLGKKPDPTGVPQADLFRKLYWRTWTLRSILRLAK